MESEHLPGKGTVAAILGGIVAIAFIGLFLLGGQISTILSNVGNSIGGQPVGGGGDTTGDTAAGSATGTADQPAEGDVDVSHPPTIMPWTTWGRR
jgi:hypothetical protein